MSFSTRLCSRFAVLLIVFALPLPSTADPATPENGGASAGKGRHLFILSGQSNMTGNLEEGFRTAVSKALGEDAVTLVKSMRSGRGIRFWVKDYALPEGHELAGRLTAGNGEEYPRLLQAVKEAGDARSFDSATLIWMQGESDANRDLSVAYERSFRTLLGHLQADLGLKRMRFIIGRISDYGLHGDKAEAWKRMREVQVRLAEADPLGGWIDTDDLNGGDDSKPEGELHYPAAGSVKLGERFAEAALKQLRSGTVGAGEGP